MMNWLKKLICNDCSVLKEENAALRDMLEHKENEILRKQEHINKTNAYWKKKLYENKSSSKKKKEL